MKLTIQIHLLRFVPTHKQNCWYEGKSTFCSANELSSSSLHQNAVGAPWSFATGNGLGVRTGRGILVRRHCHNIDVTRWLCKATGSGRDHAQTSMLRWNTWSFTATLKLPPLYPDTGFPWRPKPKNPCREYHFVDRSVANLRTKRSLKLACHTRKTASWLSCYTHECSKV